MRRLPSPSPWLCCAFFAVAVVAALATARPVRAETRRLAVVIGNNDGSGLRLPLRFAENDARKMARVMVELGGAADDEVELLQGETLAAVRAALARVASRVQRIQGSALDRVVLVFYFSGHSDGLALEMGHERLSFAEVRRWMRQTGAAVRLAIVDSCRSGGLIALKGGTLGPSFDVRLADHLASDGEALITSSASSEAALESAEIRGSFFSHHLISGLRGAADASGDGLVTLGEAYQHAFARTVSATAETLVGPQHPGYDYRLTGQGELVLTRIGAAAGVLETPGGFDRLLVIDRRRQEVVAELGASGPRRLATRPGTYDVRAWRGPRMYRGQVAIGSERPAALTVADLQEMRGLATTAKGDQVMATALWPAVDAESTPASPRGWRLGLAAGLIRGAGDQVGGLTALRLDLTAVPGWALVLEGATGRGPGFRENHLQARVGRHVHRGARLRLVAGLEAGGGLAWQDIDRGRSFRSATAVLAGVAGTEWQARGGTVLRVLADVPVTVARREGRLAALLLPGAWLGISF